MLQLPFTDWTSNSVAIFIGEITYYEGATVVFILMTLELWHYDSFDYKSQLQLKNI